MREPHITPSDEDEHAIPFSQASTARLFQVLQPGVRPPKSDEPLSFYDLDIRQRYAARLIAERLNAAP